MLCCVLLLKLGGVAKATVLYYTTMAKRRHTQFNVSLTGRLMRKLHRNVDLTVYTRQRMLKLLHNCTHLTHQ